MIASGILSAQNTALKSAFKNPLVIPPAPQNKSTKVSLSSPLLFFLKVSYLLINKSGDFFIFKFKCNFTFLAIFAASNGGTALPTRIHCSLLFPSKTILSGNVCMRAASLGVKLLLSVDVQEKHCYQEPSLGHFFL